MSFHRLRPFLCPALLGLAGLAASAAEPGGLTNSLGMKLVPVAPGSFIMGQDGPPADYRMMKHPAKFDDADWEERPAHQVNITRPFHMATTEVTVALYRQF